MKLWNYTKEAKLNIMEINSKEIAFSVIYNRTEKLHFIKVFLLANESVECRLFKENDSVFCKNENCRSEGSFAVEELLKVKWKSFGEKSASGNWINYSMKRKMRFKNNKPPVNKSC